MCLRPIIRGYMRRNTEGTYPNITGSIHSQVLSPLEEVVTSAANQLNPTPHSSPLILLGYLPRDELHPGAIFAQSQFICVLPHTVRLTHHSFPLLSEGVFLDAADSKRSTVRLEVHAMVLLGNIFIDVTDRIRSLSKRT